MSCIFASSPKNENRNAQFMSYFAEQETYKRSDEKCVLREPKPDDNIEDFVVPFPDLLGMYANMFNLAVFSMSSERTLQMRRTIRVQCWNPLAVLDSF